MSDLPVASAKKDVFRFLGELSLNSNLALSELSDFGALNTAGFGINWTPVAGYNIILSTTFCTLSRVGWKRKDIVNMDGAAVQNPLYPVNLKKSSQPGGPRAEPNRARAGPSRSVTKFVAVVLSRIVPW